MFLVFNGVKHYFNFFFKQKPAYEMRISDWSDVCSSDLRSLEMPCGTAKRTGGHLSGHQGHSLRRGWQPPKRSPTRSRTASSRRHVLEPATRGSARWSAPLDGHDAVDQQSLNAACQHLGVHIVGLGPVTLLVEHDDLGEIAVAQVAPTCECARVSVLHHAPVGSGQDRG